MKRRFPPLNALRAFEATARLLSFQKAADELNVTHSAISHQIKKLEQDLGAELFSRLGRRIVLTDLGGRYYVDIYAALQRIEHSTIEIFGEPDQGELTVQFYMGIASRWLVSRLGDFLQQYPGIHIELFSPYFGWLYERNSADLGIVYAEELDKNLTYHHLFKGALIPVCSPLLFAEKRCDSLDDLLTKPLLHVSESPNNVAYWLTHQGIINCSDVVIKEGYDNHQLALEAAIAGQGVAIIPTFFACGDIASGKLIVPIEKNAPEMGNWYIVYPNSSLDNSKALFFSNWLYKAIEQDQVLQKYIYETKP